MKSKHEFECIVEILDENISLFLLQFFYRNIFLTLKSISKREGHTNMQINKHLWDLHILKVVIVLNLRVPHPNNIDEELTVHL